MKRFILMFATLLTVAFSLSAPRYADSGEWRTKEIKWMISSVGSPFSGTAIYVRDTTYNVLAVGQADTMGWFTLDDADVPPRGHVAPGISQQGAVTASPYSAQNDTTVIGYIVLQPDTSAAVTSTATSITVMIDGRGVGTGSVATLARGWVKADSVLLAGGAAGAGVITGDESWAFPIRTISPYGNIRRWGQLRARVSAVVGGVFSGQIRAYLRYYDAEGDKK